jgi:cell division protein FtsB
MIIRRILGCSYLGFTLFILLSLFFGKSGFLGISGQQEYKTKLAANIENLKEINHALTLELKDVSSSPDTIRLYARDYGYFGRNEEVIKIQGAPSLRRLYKLGSLLKRMESTGEINPLFHIIGFSAAAVAFAFSLPLLRRHPHGRPYR